MNDLSTFRLYLLRAAYLLIAVGLGLEIWPLILHPPQNLEHMRGVARCLLAGVTLVAALGIRYPVKMLPLLLFELTWKSIWILAIGLPLWSAHRLDTDTAETMKACLMGIVIFPLVIPWPYVLANYVKAPGDRWRRRPAGDHEAAEATHRAPPVHRDAGDRPAAVR